MAFFLCPCQGSPFLHPTEALARLGKEFSSVTAHQLGSPDPDDPYEESIPLEDTYLVRVADGPPQPDQPCLYFHLEPDRELFVNTDMGPRKTRETCLSLLDRCARALGYRVEER